MVRAIEQGYPQREIGESAYKYQQALETQGETVVGVTDFLSEEERALAILKIDQRVEKEQVIKVRALRQTRNNRLLQRRLKQLENAARSEDNLMPYLLDVMQAYGTIGEVCDVLREVWGIYEEPSV
jgi:methylmalonyl-CoA mutase N-terminal domain/subunit